MVSENSKEGEFVAHVTVKDLDSGDNGEISLTVSLTLLLLFYLFLFYLSFFLPWWFEYRGIQCTAP